MAKIDANEIFEKIKGADDRVRKSIYVSEGLYLEFVKICDKQDVSMSRVMEELIAQFIASAKQSR